MRIFCLPVTRNWGIIKRADFYEVSALGNQNGGGVQILNTKYFLNMRARIFIRLALLITLFFAARNGVAQANLPIYTDNLVNAFQDWGWATRNLANTTPVHTGTDSISVTSTAGTALSFYHPDFNDSPYASLSFWAHGGPSGGQRLDVYVQYGPAGTSGTAVALPTALTANTWTQYTLSLASLGMANRTNINRINIRLTGSGTTGTFYVDDIQLNAAPAPALVHLTVNASNTVRTADARWFGVNTATWDGNLGSVATAPLMRQNGLTTLRWPGGSTSDAYHWTNDIANNNTFNKLATNIGANVFITVNYGSGSSNEAAAWVKSVNVTNNYGFKYWEIGNECYGTWETDSNTPAHDPYTYAVRAAGYIALMKAADPTIKIGVVAAPGEGSYSNNASHFAVNPRTSTTNYGWTPVVLSTLKTLGVTPDFLVHHVYPQFTSANPTTGTDSDPFALQASVNWALDAADLRQQLTDYLGANGANVELTCTENNSDSGSQGRQSTSVVNGLFLADNLAQIMKTEFNSYIWWDFRNGTDTTGCFDPTLYGWRTTGALGMLGGASSPIYPTFYAEKLMQYFVRAGDTVLNPTSDYLLLSDYAARRTNGSLTVLVINKDVTTNFTAQITLTNFFPAGTALVRSFGITQDEATRTNNPAPGSQDISTNMINVVASFTSTFPAGSLTLITFTSGTSNTVTLTSGANPSTYGTPVTFTATVRTNGVAVGGIGGETVRFFSGAVQIGTGTLNASGQAAYTTTATQLVAGAFSITAVYGGDTVYAVSTNSPAVSQTVNAAILTAGLTGTVSKNYNGTLAATLAAGNYVLPGVVSGDTVTLNSPTSGTYDTRNQGTGKTVTVTGLAISGASAANYTLSGTSVSGAVGTINKTNLTVTAAANTKPYDGTNTAAATPTVTAGSIQSGDTSGFTESYDNKNVGTGKSLTPSGLANDGNGGNNYNYTFVATANGTITTVPLTYAANPASMTYGSSAPGLSGSVSGFVSGDNQGNATSGTMIFTSPATSSSGVGSYAINGSGLTANNGNYTFGQAAGNATALAINPLPVILTGARPYDGTTAATSGILSVTNQVGTDDVTVSSGSGSVAAATVGLQAITSFGTLTLGGTAATNYTLSAASGSVNILALVAPVFVNPALSQGAGGWQLSFSAQAGQTYQVLVADDPSLPVNQWTVLTNGTFGAGTATVTDDSTNLPMRFYLIVSP